MRQIGCTETSAINYTPSLLNILQVRKHHLYCVGSLKFVLQAAWQNKSVALGSRRRFSQAVLQCTSLLPMAPVLLQYRKWRFCKLPCISRTNH